MRRGGKQKGGYNKPRAQQEDRHPRSWPHHQQYGGQYEPRWQQPGPGYGYEPPYKETQYRPEDYYPQPQPSNKRSRNARDDIEHSKQARTEQSSNKQLQQQVGELEKKIRDLRSTLGQKERKLNDSDAENLALLTKVATLTDERDNSNSRVQELEASLAQAQRDLDTVKTGVTKLFEQLP